MPLEVVCRECKQPYTPAPGDVLSGIWRLCPACRPQPTGEHQERPRAA